MSPSIRQWTRVPDSPHNTASTRARNRHPQRWRPPAAIKATWTDRSRHSAGLLVISVRIAYRYTFHRLVLGVSNRHRGRIVANHTRPSRTRAQHAVCTRAAQTSAMRCQYLLLERYATLASHGEVVKNSILSNRFHAFFIFPVGVLS